VSAASEFHQPYDLVILNGRVMDPESNFDGIRNVGVKDGTIVVKDSKVLKGVYPGQPIRLPVHK